MNWKGLMIFTAGVVTGAVPAALYFKKKYQVIADEEIKSVIKEFSDHEKINVKIKNDSPENKKSDKDELTGESSKDNGKNPEGDISEKVDDSEISYHNIFKKRREYIKSQMDLKEADPSEIDPYVNPDDLNEDNCMQPYEIEDSDCNTDDDYDLDELYIYADGIVCGSDKRYIPNKYDYIPEDIFEMFMNDNRNIMYLRNTKLKINYTVLKDDRNYQDVVLELPPNLRW